MSNIGFFFPKREKGNALALNAGLGNLGVSLMQFVVPLVVTMSVFGAFGGEAQIASSGEKLFLQNAGFIWAPFIALSAFAAWFGMNDLSTAKASFADQAVIFKRKHNWIMCWLYTGTFGSFIGFRQRSRFSQDTVSGRQRPSDRLPRASGRRAVALLTGWIADRFGGARVTLVVFLVMMAGTVGVLYFLV
jgi:NNP family nitrate/nitrite transporter-like MFS transporter